MPLKKTNTKKKLVSIDSIRHSEYYNMQNKLDDLYARSKNGEVFTNLMDLILSRENILMAYREIKTNKGANTPGIDKLTIKDISKLSPDEVVNEVRNRLWGQKKIGYKPQPVKRKEILKKNGSIRPLGIPCIWDRLIQQCIKQILEPICEAKFSNHSYGFRPMRSTEHAIADLYRVINKVHCYQIIEFDIKSFFDNIDHVKLIHQLWALGIRDTSLIFRIKSILKCPIKLPNGKIYHPKKGTPQGGIISPLLANVVLNELDHWIESQWEDNPVIYTNKNGTLRKLSSNSNGSLNRTNGFTAMRKTKLKEMYIVRYADDFRILCKTRNQAIKTKIAVSKWLKERLRLDISPEKTKIVNIKKKFSEFLGFKIKVKPKSNKYVVTSHVSDKQLEVIRDKLVSQVKKIARPKDSRNEFDHIKRYNSMVLGEQNYYRLATEINIDFSKVNRAVMMVLVNRLQGRKGRLVRSGRKLTSFEQTRFGTSNMIRYVKGSEQPIYPIGYVQMKKPMCLKFGLTPYSPEGRVGSHDNLRLKNINLMIEMMKQPIYDQSIEYADNRISKFSAQLGRCAITRYRFESLDEIHCHHIIPLKYGGNDRDDNLILIHKYVHKLIHAIKDKTIHKYLEAIDPDEDQLKKINDLRKSANRKPITVY